jgi:hypothetical protein
MWSKIQNFVKTRKAPHFFVVFFGAIFSVLFERLLFATFHNYKKAKLKVALK